MNAASNLAEAPATPGTGALNLANAILSDASEPSISALNDAVARLTADPSDLTANLEMVRIASRLGHNAMAKRYAERTLDHYEHAEDLASLSALACFITRSIDPEWGLDLILDKCIAKDRFELGNPVYEEALKMAGLHDVLKDVLERSAQEGKFYNVNGFDEAALEQQQANIAAGYGYVLLNTMPKSGSVYFANHLKSIYQSTFVRIGVDSFPRSRVVPARARLLAQGGLWDQMHLDASRDNLDGLAAAGIRKIYLHVRDPRQATLSWLHHLDSEDATGADAFRRLSLWKRLPPGYDGMPWQAKLDWHVVNTYPAFVRWTTEWLKAIATERQRFEIRVGEFAAFAADPIGAARGLLTFFGLPESVRPTGDSMRNKHYRKGRANEWRDVFSERQQVAMNARITPEMRDTFGWE